MAALRSPLTFPARRPDSPPMLMILTHPLRRMCGAAALAHRMYPTSLVLMSSSKSSSSACDNGPLTTPPGRRRVVHENVDAPELSYGSFHEILNGLRAGP